MSYKKVLLGILMTMLFSFVASAQIFKYKGVVVDTTKKPLPMVSIFFEDGNFAVETEGDGTFSLDVRDGIYNLVFKRIGYQTQTRKVVVRGNSNNNLIILRAESQSIEGVKVRSKKSNLAKRLVKRIIDNAKNVNVGLKSYSCKAYIKATNYKRTNKKQKVKRKKKKSLFEMLDSMEQTNGLDSVKIAKKDSINRIKAKTRYLDSMQVAEVSLTLNVVLPNKSKEIVDAKKVTGERDLFYFLSTTEAKIDAYKNLIYIPTISKNAFVSPISRMGLSAYKYKIAGVKKINGNKLYKIKFYPRTFTNAALKGFMWVDTSFNLIKSIKLVFPKKHLIAYDQFVVFQKYKVAPNSQSVLKEQRFYYLIGNTARSTVGKTSVSYTQYEINKTFPKKYFSNEVGVEQDSAFDRDSIYWLKVRKQPLNAKEYTKIRQYDSIKIAHSKDEYLDSIDKITNKITLLNLMLYGQEHINRKKQTTISFRPLIQTYEFIQVAGPRVGYWVKFYKKFKNFKSFTIFPYLTYGLNNKDVNGLIGGNYFYNPRKLSRISFNFGKNFDMINNNAAFINLLRRDNFYLNKSANIRHSTELFNGFFFGAGFHYSSRKSLEDYTFSKYGDSLFVDNKPEKFKPYDALNVNAWISYTPYQKYIKRKKYKKILGSKYPTFSLFYKRAIPGFNGTVTDFDYLRFTVRQKFRIGLMGESSYRFTTGSFLNKKDVRLVDYVFQRQGDNYLFTPPMFTFQMLDTTLETFGQFYKIHYQHRFNGALIGKIPLLKKLQLREVVGASILYAQSDNYFHTEAYVGLERIVRVWNERFKVGLFFATGESNKFKPRFQFKFALDYFDRRNGNWSFE